MTASTTAQLDVDPLSHHYYCSGAWSILGLSELHHALKTISPPDAAAITINGKDITQMDSAGAMALNQLLQRFAQHQCKVTLTHFSHEQQTLLNLINQNKDALEYIEPLRPTEGLIYQLGVLAVNKLQQVDGLIILIGNLSDKLLTAALHWKRFQIPSVISNVFSAGVQALPIIALLSFLIGVVLAYQMGLQLETYGANIFIAFLSGLACFREFAPLITAIIVAGRTSSAFTAQIGSMKINEEIDALETMGLSPVELLVLPKLLALLIVFPLLIFWSDGFSILGAMIISKIQLGVGYSDFLVRLKDSVGAKQMLLGLYKAPVFAILIALVGCYQGFNVEANSSSIGSQTTKSVVQSLFLIIIADAVYSVIYSWLHL